MRGSKSRANRRCASDLQREKKAQHQMSKGTDETADFLSGRTDQGLDGLLARPLVLGSWRRPCLPVHARRPATSRRSFVDLDQAR